MSDRHAQQRAAAAASVRSRIRTKLVRQLASAPPLTREQRDQVLVAAARIPVLEDGAR